MTIVCPQCSAKVPAGAVNLDRMIAKCESCDAVFRFESQLDASRGGSPRTAPPRTAASRAARPPAIVVEGELAPEPGVDGYRSAIPRSRGPLRISYRWFRPSALFLLGFALFWCGFLVFFYVGLAASGAPLFAFLFPLLHVAVGVGMGYSAISQLLNRTVIAIDDRMLTVRHAPLPWLGTPSVEIARVRQLFVRRRTSRGRKGGARTTYAVCADVDGVAVDLVRGLHEHDEARYIEQAIEDHLAIEHDPGASDPA